MRQEQDGTVAAQVAKEPFLAPVRMLRLCCSTKRPPRWDFENKIAIGGAVDAIRSDQTLVVVAHRLQTIMTADRIVLLNGSGVIRETSTHTELLATGTPTPITGPNASRPPADRSSHTPDPPVSQKGTSHG
ncbi:hypothetical protein [Salinispora arenicola]|uniref:hypothetical protein n=1 Tax=Salinispora arenicola TaxID=168697 RepID=UPI00039BD063|nr:hypothetical protein [Salinispora arenicola]